VENLIYSSRLSVDRTIIRTWLSLMGAS